jgi:hypothetical protein
VSSILVRVLGRGAASPPWDPRLRQFILSAVGRHCEGRGSAASPRRRWSTSGRMRERASLPTWRMSQRTTTGHVLAARVRIALTRVCAAGARGLCAAWAPRGRPSPGSWGTSPTEPRPASGGSPAAADGAFAGARGSASRALASTGSGAGSDGDGGGSAATRASAA